MQVLEHLCVLEGRIAAQEALLEKKHAETTKLLLSLGANPNAAASNSAPPRAGGADTEERARKGVMAIPVAVRTPIAKDPNWGSMTWTERLQLLNEATASGGVLPDAETAAAVALFRLHRPDTAENAMSNVPGGLAPPPPMPLAETGIVTARLNSAIVSGDDDQDAPWGGVSAQFSPGGGGRGGETWDGFPLEDLKLVCGPRWYAYVLAAVAILIIVLVSCSVEKVSSEEVALAYNKIHSALGHTVLTEGLKSKATFGYLVKWPLTNQRVDIELTCNSRDAIEVPKLEFLNSNP